MGFCRFGNRGKFVPLALLAISLCLGAPFSAQQAPTPWVVGQVLIAGTSVTVEPAQQSVPLNVGTVVNTKYGNGQGVPPAGYLIAGDLEGPAFGEPQHLSAVPNQPLQIPPLPVAGTYYVRNIRLMSGATQIASAEPSQVQIDAGNIVITQVTSRPMTMEEIQGSGIVLNTDDYKVYRYTVGLGLTSGTVTLDFPVLFSATDPTRPPIVLSKMGLPGPPPLPNVLPGSSGSAIPDLAGIDLEPIALTIDDGGDLDLEIPGLNLSGLLVFPNRITFLNQFFVVGIMLQNGAPAGSTLQLDQMAATIHLPGGSDFVLRGTVPPMVNGAVPVTDPGPDGVLGTADDVAILAAGMQGQGEFQVTTPKSGTYTVDIEFNGTLLGLPSGQSVPVKGHAAGVVVVRDPTFHVTFAHPAVVRQNEEYAIKVTLSNTSEVAANDVSLSLPSGQISGAALLSGQPSLVSLGTLQAGESKTAEFRLLALKTGQVTTTSSAGTGGTTGTVELTTGVGDAGIPLSPDTLVLPRVVTETLPAEVVTSALDFLGLGWSLATAPPNARPAGMAPVSEGQVRFRAQELTALARYVRNSQSPDYTLQNALAELALQWLGNNAHDAGFDALRRLPADDFGPSKGMQFAQALGAHLISSGQSIPAAHEAFVRATRILSPHFSAALDSAGVATPPKLWIEDGQGRRLGDAETAGLVRDIPWGESYPFGAGRLLAIGHLEGDEGFTVHLDGQGEGTVDLSILAPLAGGPTLVRFQGIQVGQASKARIVFTQGATGLILENDLTGAGNFSQINPSSSIAIPLPPLAALGAIQDLMADTSGRAVSLLFNRPADKASAETLSNYSLDTRSLLGAFLQPDGRIVEIRAHSTLSPLVENHLTVSGVLAAGDLSAMNPASATFTVVTFLTGPAGRVHGTVFGEDGAPLPGAAVGLWEFDEEDLFGDPIEHRTASTTTDAEGRFELDYVRLTGKTFSLEASDPATSREARLKAMLTFDQQVMEVALFMRARGSVRGTVYAPGGAPAIGALVTATEASTGEWVQAFTDYDGRYLIEKLPVGTIRVHAQAAGGPHADATTYLDHAGAVATVNLTLVDTPTGGVKGVVKNAGGTPSAGAVAALAIGNDVYTSCFTDQNGSFQMEGILPGSYGFAVHEPVTFIPRINQTITVTGGQVLDLGTLILPEPASGSGTVTGHVYMPDGLTPVAGASVYAGTSMGGVIVQTTADSGGGFSLAPLPIGTWTITAYDPATHRTTSGQATIASDGQTVGITLYFPALGLIQGTVYKYLPGGSKVPAPSVTVKMGGREVATDASGHYQFTDVPLGEHRLIAVSGDPPSDIGKTTVRLSFAGQILTAEITLLGRGELKVHTMIRGQNGQPDQAVAALVNTFTYRINPQDLSLDTMILTANSDATEGIVTFPDLLGTSVTARAENGFNGAGAASTLVRAGLTTDLYVYLETTGNVEGSVFAPDGVTAVPHALVTLSIPGLPDRSVAADTAGHYAFDLVTKGSLTVKAEETSTGRWGTAQGLLSNPAVPLRLDVRLLGAGQVQGTVLEDDGQGGTVPAVNATVTLEGPSPLPKRTVVTDLLGQFLLNDVVEGTYSVDAVDPYHTFPLAGRTSVTVEKGQTAQVSLRLGSFGTVTGTLLMPDGTTPVPNAQIVMVLNATSQHTGFALTDTQGRFSFTYVLVNAPFTLQALDPRSGRSASGSGQISTAGQVLDVPLQLTAVGTLWGYVTNHAGDAPIANPTVRANSSMASAVVTTGDAGGKYELPGIPQGTYGLSATDPANGATANATAAIQSEGEIVQQDLAMPAFGTVSGTVYQPDGTTPVEGAIVTLDATHAVATNASGQFQFGGVALGTYWVKANDALSRDGGKARVSVDEDQQVVQTSIRFVGLGTVTGVVKDASGNPVEGFQVTLTDTNDYTGTEAAGPTGTPANGTFEFQDQRVGHISVTAIPPAGTGDARRGTAQGDLTADGDTLNLVVTLSPAGTVRGRVVDESTAPVLGALVTLAKNDNSGTWSTGTSATGGFTFPVIPIGSNGAFSLTITGPWGGHARGAGELTSDWQILDLGDITLDTVPPAATSTEPASQAANVPIGLTLAAAFSEPLDPTSILYGSTVRLVRDEGNQLVPAILTVAPDNQSLSLDPTQDLAPQTAYTFTLGQGILDVNGNGMANNVAVRFTTLDIVPPVVATAYPANGAAQVPVEAYPFVIFDEEIAPDSIAQGVFSITSSGGAVTGTVSQPEPKKILFAPTAGTILTTDTLYTMAVSGFRDLAGNTMTPWTGAFVTLDTIAPQVTLTLNPATVLPGGNASLEASASDNLGVARVEFFASEALVGTDTEAPYAVTYTAPNTNGTTVSIRATAYDRGGNAANDTKDLVVSADGTVPQLTVTSPAAGAEYVNGSTLAMSATATDDTGVASVEFRLQDLSGNLLWSQTVTAPPYQAAYPVTGLTENLERNVVVRAVDGFGNAAQSDPILVHFVYDHPPVATVVSPASGASAIAGGTLRLEITASDADGSVTAVDFFINGALEHSFSAPPYIHTYNVTEPVGGTLTFMARVTGDKGETVETTPVTLTVVQDPGTTVQGQVVDAQNVGIQGATVTIDGTGLTATTGTGGAFEILNAPAAGGPITIKATYVNNGVTYTATKAGITPVLGGTTQAGAIALLNLNDTSAIKGNIQLEGSAFRAGRWAGNQVMVATTSSTLSQNHVYLLDVSVPSSPSLVSPWTSAHGVIHDMKVSGNLVVLGDDGLTLLQAAGGTLSEVATMPASAFSGMSGSYPNVLAVKGQTVYVGNHHYVWAVDISTPSSPAVLSRTDPGQGTLQDLAVYGNELLGSSDMTYNCCNTGLVVGLLDDPASPSWNNANYVNLGSVTGDNYYPAARLLVDGSTLYVSRNTYGVAAFDLSAAVKPAYIGKTATTGDARGMAGSSGQVYLANGPTAGLTVIQNANTASPTVVAQQDTPGDALDVTLAGSVVAVADGAAGLTTVLYRAIPPVVDTSLVHLTPGAGTVTATGGTGCATSANPPLAFLVTDSQTGASHSGVFAGDGSFSGTVTAVPGDEILLTVTDSASPVQSTTVSLGKVPAGNPAAFWDVAGSDIRQVAVADGYLAVNGTDRVSLVDPSQTWPQGLLATWPAAGLSNHGTIHDMKVSGNLVVLGDNGLTLLQAAGGTLSEVATMPASAFSGMSGSYPNVLAVKGQTVYVGNHHYVWAVDISTPSSPAVLSRTDPGQGTLQDLAVYGNELLGSSDMVYNCCDTGLVVGLLDNPASPSWSNSNYVNLGAVTGDGYRPAARLLVDGSTLYVSRDTFGVAAFDLAAAVKPTYKGKVFTPGTSQGMAHLGSRLYVAAGYGTGMVVVDTSDLSNLRQVVANPVNGTPHDIAIKYGKAYVATGGGVWVIQLMGSAPPGADKALITLSVQPGQAVVNGLAGAVTGAFLPLSVVLENTAAGATSVVIPNSDGSFSGTVAAAPGDEILLTVTDSASPVQSTTISLGKLPAGNPAAFLDVAGSDIRQVAVADGYLAVNGTDRVSLVDPSQTWPQGLLATWPAAGLSNHGTIHDMKVSGNLVVLGDDGLTLLQAAGGALSEVATMAASAFSGMSGSYPNVLAVKGQTVYVGNHHYVWAVDISTPSSPAVLSRTDPGQGTLQDLAVYGNELLGSSDMAYNCCDTGLVVGLLDNPASPSWSNSNYVNLGAVTGDGYRPAARLLVDGSTLYVSRDTFGVAAFDLAAAVKPTYKGKVFTPGTSQGMAHLGSRLYVAAGYGTGMVVVDTSDLASLRQVVANPVNGTPHDIAIKNGKAFVATGGGVWVIPLTGTAPPGADRALITLVVQPGEAVVQGLAGAVTGASPPLWVTLENAATNATSTIVPNADGSFSGTVAAAPGDEILLTVTDSASPVQSTTVSLGKVPAGNPAAFLDVAGSDIRQVAVADGYLAVNGTDRVSLVDPSQTWPQGLLATWPAAGLSNHGTIHDMKVSGNLVVLGDNGLTLLQAAGGTLSEVATMPASAFSGMSGSYPNVLAVKGQTVYVGNHHYVWAVDISTPSSPAVLSRTDPGQGTLQDLAVYGNELLGSSDMAYNCCDTGLVVGLLDNPASPSWSNSNYVNLGAVTGDGYRPAARLLVDGSTLYVSRDTFGVAAFDLAVAVKPTYKGKVFTPGTSQGMAHLGSRLYVAAGFGTGMVVVDTTDLTNLRQVVANPVSGTPHDVAIHNGYAYAATGGGVWVLQLVSY